MSNGEPLHDAYRTAMRRAGRRYFSRNDVAVSLLPIPRSDQTPTLELLLVPLPDWAADIGVGSTPGLIVDRSCVQARAGEPFERCDWWRAAFLHLEGWLEQSVEAARGPIHSYSTKLPRRWASAYDHAWVNRIFLFLRRWAARHLGKCEEAIFGPVPRARFILTHDVDALRKTPPMRIKRVMLDTAATVRLALEQRWSDALARARAGVRFSSTGADYWLFDIVCSLEAKYGFRSIFLFGARTSGLRSPITWLLDPDYRIDEPRVKSLIKRLLQGGWEVGVHPGIHTWNNATALAELVRLAQRTTETDVYICRQHWLKFGWADTWAAQTLAGIRLDLTLGFNDRPGFRSGAALRYQPWDKTEKRPRAIEVVPTVLMDSQFYDYAHPQDPAWAMAPWVDEVVAVGGEASLLWHVHTMHDGFGWAQGYESLLALLQARCADVVGTRPECQG